MACLSIERYLQQNGGSLRSVVEKSLEPGALVPTLCEHGCEIELRAVCPHGCRSVALLLMIAGYKWEDIDR